LGIALFPVLYLFSFLYYTDVMSTFSVLMMYLCHLYGQSILAGIFGNNLNINFSS
jgi:DIE2/ALG10 family